MDRPAEKPVQGDRNKAKILLNATTLAVGGGISVGVSFLEQACKRELSNLEFLFAVTEQIYSNLPADLKKDRRILVFRTSPARPIRGHWTRVVLKRVERQFNPDIVFTLGLPSYTRFAKPEVGRYTNPWEINEGPLPWHVLSVVKRLRVFLLVRYRLFWANRAVFYLTQTESAKRGIVRKLGVPENRVKVVANSLHPLFKDRPSRSPDDSKAIIFCLAAEHPHKNLRIIPDVARELKETCPHKIFHFVITLPKAGRLARELLEKSKRLKVESMIENVGPLRLRECVHQYERSNLVFLPTLLEVFSATYLEAMAMGRPIVTTDFDFTRAICGDAAIYFDPDSASDAARAITHLLNDPSLREDVIERGRRRLDLFPDADEQHESVFSWLEEVTQVIRGRRETVLKR